MDKFNFFLDKYRDTVAINPAQARKYIQKLDYKNNFYLLKCIAQTYLDESRFEDYRSCKMRARIDKRNWGMAERYIIKAFKLNADNAEVLYTMGEIRKLYDNQIDLAIYCFETIIKLEVNTIAKQEYSRGKKFANELINDAKFELYRIYFDLNPKLSEKYLRMYKQGIDKGITTIYKPLKKFLLE